jgi:phosphate-selective porin OprO and OprP
MKKQFSFVLFVILTSQFLFSQTELDERAVIRFDKGLGFFAPDSTFGLNLRFRMQNRLGFTTESEDDFSISEVEARIRRLRLRIDGYMKSSKLTYYLQLSFSRSDQDFDESGVPHIIRDAMVYYHFNENFYVGFGQGKLPGNRERITSSGHLQFTDRSIVNSVFNIDRDFGVFAYYTLRGKSALVNFKTAISSGEGRNAPASDNGLAYTGRIEFLPFGSFKNDGDFAQGDTERETSPRLAIAASYSNNQKAVRLSGQRGKALFEPRDLESFFVDLIFKYRGWAYYSEYAVRAVNSPVLIDEESNTQFVFDGHGFNNQLSYRFNNMFELAFRYSYVVPNNSILDLANNSSVYTLGLNKYIWKHKVKVQTNLSYLSDKPESVPAKNKWNLQFQVELGI